MGAVSVFFDTYALFEVLKKNPEYSRFVNDVAVITTRLNLMELYYGLLTKHGEEVAESAYSGFLPHVVDIDDDTIKEAMKFKASARTRALSYVDCVGYALARRLNIKFLTGDRQFKEMPNVQWVK